MMEVRLEEVITILGQEETVNTEAREAGMKVMAKIIMDRLIRAVSMDNQAEAKTIMSNQMVKEEITDNQAVAEEIMESPVVVEAGGGGAWWWSLAVEIACICYSPYFI